MIVCSFDDGVDYTIDVAGKRYRFEFSEMFGPLVVDKTGREVVQPSHGSLFWRAVSLWARQGKRVANGLCDWHEPKGPVTRRDGGRDIVVEHGEDGWDWSKRAK